jgi:hypothetical protein
MRPSRSEVSPKKSEKFCSTRRYIVCDKGKLVLEPNRSPNFFNYENITYYLPMLTRVCADFARASSRAATNIAARTASSSCESGCPRGGEPSRAGGTADCDRTSRRTCRARRDNYRHVKPCAGRRSKPFADCRGETQWRPARH